jgi:hypothetical protein
MSLRLRDYSRRVRLGLVLILAFAAVSSARWLGAAYQLATDPPTLDEISATELRLEEMRRVVPPHTVVGYLSDRIPPGQSRAESREHFQRYVLTQYSLAPALVVHGTEPHLIVGHFTMRASVDTAAAMGLTLVRDFGDGIYLFERTRP